MAGSPSGVRKVQGVACLSKTRKAGLCVPLRGAGLEVGGRQVEDPAGVQTGGLETWHPWGPAAVSRVLGCGTPFVGSQAVGHEIYLVDQKHFLSELV